MNPFGVSRRILLSIFLCVASGLSAEQPKSLDLVYRSLDLKYSALGLEGGAQNVGGKGESTGGTSSALKSEVVDLKAASAQIKAAGAEIKETASEIKISLQGEILFDFDKSNLRPAAESTLAQVAKMIGSYPRAQVLIEGYTDSKGSDSYNAKLSDRRAVSVKNWFAKHGVAANSMQTHGWGAAKPVASNTHPDGSDDPDGRQKNRRVEITIKK
ncbi:MAG TPA: OmpA family protein [Chthoniobacterales bacterium]|jgi:outer membrane protein OmpA-like peptidoglycan-associated protein|nr:OmpA family protein [Chthoniobacterales bacterium]